MNNQIVVFAFKLFISFSDSFLMTLKSMPAASTAASKDIRYIDNDDEASRLFRDAQERNAGGFRTDGSECAHQA
jgi:hypothetical protein